jgi:prepilin-type N-terminal cleavage/methylation domain-containing protein
MKYHNAFTMMELVFVIVVIGILATIALPRYLNTLEEAHVAKLISFVGTLDRTVGPSVWSELQRFEPSAAGHVTRATNPIFYSLGTPSSTLGSRAQLESIPSIFGTNLLDLRECTTVGTPIPAIGSTPGSLIGGDLKQSDPIGNTTYTLGCVDSDFSQPPRFYVYDSNGGNGRSPSADQIIFK